MNRNRIFAFIAVCFIALTSCNGFDSHNSGTQLMKLDRNALKKLSSSSDENSFSPINFDEQKAVWISYIDLQPMLLGKTAEEFGENISNAFKKVKNLGCNTVYCHVRSFGDAYYKSNLFPFSKEITGNIGADPGFDPLEIMIEKAHGQGLSIHAWINPMRCETEENIKAMDDSYIIKQWYSDKEKYADYIVKPDSDNHYWLNPGVPEVRKLIADGVKEIVENYQVDGIHIDDYFYPTTDAKFDVQYYVESKVSESFDQWRKDNISKMVKSIYDSAKSADDRVLFGVSPQGNMENNYDFMYADVKKWCSEEGYLDYIVPQIYFGFDNSVKPFEKTAEEWSKAVTNKSVKLVIGLGIYKIGEEEEFMNTEGIIGKQIENAKNLKNYGGVALYNYINLFEPSEELAERTNVELKYIKKELK
ncbi:MAG: glycoside hydrolase family 10 protein [Oscillospiraceae bacterium]